MFHISLDKILLHIPHEYFAKEYSAGDSDHFEGYPWNAWVVVAREPSTIYVNGRPITLDKGEYIGFVNALALKSIRVENGKVLLIAWRAPGGSPGFIYGRSPDTPISELYDLVNTRTTDLVDNRYPIAFGVRKSSITKLVDGETIAAGSSLDVVLQLPSWASTVWLTLKCSGACHAELYSSPDNTNYDTEAIGSITLTGAGQKSDSFGLGTPYLKIHIVNDSSTDITVDLWEVEM